VISSEDKALYQSYVSKHSLPIFFESWYLDAVCQEGQWGASIAIRNEEVKGVWPYILKKKYGQQYITQPPLTSFLGPYIHRPQSMAKEATWISHQKVVLSDLFDLLPSHLLMISHWMTDQNNWLPLYWKQCKQTTRYTYQIDLNHDIELLWKAISDKQRNRIRNSEKSYQISKSEELSDLKPLIASTYERKQEALPYSYSTLAALDAVLINQQKRKLILVESNTEIVAGVYLIYDKKSAYLIITGRSDSEVSGGVSLAIWEAIKFAKNRGLHVFDFEGSMMERIETFFRSFGGQLVPYHRVTHTPGKFSEIVFRALNRI